VNKLGEYLIATPARRRRIIFDAKYPQEFITRRYLKAESAIKDFYLNAAKDERIILNAIKELQEYRPKNKHQLEVKNSCIDALSKFLKLNDNFAIVDGDKHYYEGINKSATLNFAGTEISVRPEVLIFENGEICGAVKLYLSKSHPLSKDSGEYISTLIKSYLEEEYDLTIKARNCFVLDVFSNNIFIAPNAFKKRLNDIEAACEEISSRWPTI
jgi:hypothetical protein